ncbi:MAG: electron transport proteins [uncultured Phycisphaerae bacterium]|uniref:Electron transport proteins n=1 Tax=uncultured Phycisphaerae bacterium TaxID=904963 RepID=A0A6J4NVQ3_9BACT|nr:MAG: electron transport proteins [uncultured Phycisphaerae bacterium]
MKTRTTLPAIVLTLGVGLWALARPDTPTAAPAPAAGRYAPEALLTYQAADSAAAPVKTPADWPKRRGQIMTAMQQVMGPLPDRCALPPLDVTVLAEEKGDGFVRQTISYVSEVDPKTNRPDRVPAYLYLPTNLKPGERRPAVLALHPTSKLGKDEISGAGKPNREYGLELAKRGYVVLCPDYPSFGDLAGFDFKASPHPSGTMKGVVNHLRGVDLLAGRPEADAGRIAAIGHSLGGHNALFAAAFDERIKAVVTSCGWNVFEDYYEGNLTGWTSDRYMPRIKSEFGLSPARVPFDFHEVLAAIAPRAVLSISPTNDANFAVEGVRKGVTAARGVYALLGAPSALQVEHPDCGHDFPPAMRERAYAFIDAALKGDAAARGGPAHGNDGPAHAKDGPTAAPWALGASSTALTVPVPTTGATSQGTPPAPPWVPAAAPVNAAPVPAPVAAALPSTAPTTQPTTGAKDLASELPRIPARSPEEAAKLIRTLPGFKAQIVAAEPLVFSPVAIDFDEDGRAFVCEMIDYPFPSPEPMGKIAVLEDTNGDGVYDRRTELAGKLHWPTAVLCYDGGAFVGSAPDIFYLKDTDGDGRADVRKVVFTGFGKQNVQGLLNSFHWGIDNRVHGATGTNGGKVRRADLPPNDPAADPANAVNLSGRDFSFDPRKLDLRPESGGAQHGMSFDDFGRKFVSSNSDHIQQVVYDDRYAGRNPHVQLPPARVSIAADGPQAAVFRISPVEPWRVVRTRMRASGEVKGIVEGGGRPAGYFTGATGVTIYRGDAFPAEYRGQAFIGDVGSNLVHRKVLKPTDGVLLRAERVDEDKEFLASEDIWFRPAQFASAPDGTLYVLDVCREVIEHPASIPESVKQHLDMTNGRDRGRIYRVVRDGGWPTRKAPKLSTATTAELIEALQHDNGWHRDTASRLLYQRQDPAAVKPLTDVAESGAVGDHGKVAGRVHALYALQSLGAKTELGRVLRRKLEAEDDAPGVLLHVVRLAEQNGIWPSLARHRSLELVLQQTLSIGALARPAEGATRTGGDAVAELLRTTPSDRYIQAAALGAVIGDVGPVFWKVVRHPAPLDKPEVQGILRSLARMAATRGNVDDMADVAKAIDAVLVDNSPEAARQAVAGLVEGMIKAGPAARERVLAGRTADVFANLFAEAKRGAADAKRPTAGRAADVRTLALGSFADVRETLANLLGGKEPQEVQLAAVAALDAFADPAVGDVLTKAWPRLTPRVRAAAIDVVLARPARAVAFLTAIQNERIPSTDLDATRLARLRQGNDAAVRKLADAVAERVKLSPRADVVAAYRKSLELKGDVAKGRALFAQNCATCHRLENAGTEIGPNLAAMQSRGAEAVLVNVLDPNREVNGLFVEYVVETTDGRSLSGLLSGESAASVTLLKPGGLTETVARADIEKLRSTGLSLMPEGLEKQLDPQAMADLVAYVMGAK